MSRSVRLGSGVPRVIGSPGCWGEWRNGRRAGFRCQCPSGRGGSSPPSPTKPDEASHRLRVTRLDFFGPLNRLLGTAWPRVEFGVPHVNFLPMRAWHIALVSVDLFFSACSTVVYRSAARASPASFRASL